VYYQYHTERNFIMLKVQAHKNSLKIGKRFSVSFQRTLRIPDDGREYPLPPSLGSFPILRVEDYADRVPAAWREHGGVFIPMYQREAMWMSFSGQDWHPNAVKIGIGKINALSGKPWDERLSRGKEDYMVIPDQPWLDGINAGNGFIRQFVAMPLGMGYTVEGQLTGKEEFGGVQIMCYEAKQGRFPDKAPFPDRNYFAEGMMCCLSAPAPAGGAEMGLGAGGKMKQSIYPDEYGFDTWDESNTGRVYVHIVNSTAFREITGMEPPATPVSARAYTDAGYPWFDLYDEGKGDIAPADELTGIKSVKQMDALKGFTPQQDDDPIDVAAKQVVPLGKSNDEVTDGTW
jgi:hypothetical protein